LAVGDKICNDGLNLALSRLHGTTLSAVSVAQIGVGTTTPAASDTTLGQKIPFTGDTVQLFDDSTDWTGSADATAAANNTTTYKEMNDSTDDTSQSFGKSGSASATVTYSSDIVSDDMSNANERFYVWFYIKDATALAKFETTANGGIRIYISDDNFTKADYWNIGGSDSSVGWNLADVSVASPDGTIGAGADLSAIIDVRVQFIVTGAAVTLTSGDLIFDSWQMARVGTTDFNSTSFDAGPTYDTSLKTVETQTKILTTEANGFSISEVGLFNTESTPDMFSHHVFTGQSKTRTDEYRITCKYVAEEGS